MIELRPNQQPEPGVPQICQQFAVIIIWAKHKIFKMKVYLNPDYQFNEENFIANYVILKYNLRITCKPSKLTFICHLLRL